MLGTIGKLFGRSPFAPLEAHMAKVSACVHKLPALFDALEKGDVKLVEARAEEISRLEHAADLAKHDIRNHLPKSLFLPVDRSSILEMVSIQDHLADLAEDLAILLTLKQVPIPSGLAPKLRDFLKQTVETFELTEKIMHELPELLECSFGGKEAEKVRIMVDEVALAEHLADLKQRALVKEILGRDTEFTHASFFIWMRFVEIAAGICNSAERLANRIRMTLELK